MIIGECTEPYKWQICLNADHPVVLGEFELVSHYQQLFAGQPFVCSNPTGLEVKTVDDREPSSTGDTFCFTLKEGFYCLNQIIIPKKEKMYGL